MTSEDLAVIARWVDAFNRRDLEALAALSDPQCELRPYLASMIEHINNRLPVHILTIEDPIEYTHQHRVAAIDQREVGVDAQSFARALRSALREERRNR